MIGDLLGPGGLVIGISSAACEEDQAKKGQLENRHHLIHRGSDPGVSHGATRGLKGVFSRERAPDLYDSILGLIVLIQEHPG
jgi:hypothetical protein